MSQKATCPLPCFSERAANNGPRATDKGQRTRNAIGGCERFQTACFEGLRVSRVMRAKLWGAPCEAPGRHKAYCDPVIAGFRIQFFMQPLLAQRFFSHSPLMKFSVICANSWAFWASKRENRLRLGKIQR
jgi:hypothetical protein